MLLGAVPSRSVTAFSWDLAFSLGSFKMLLSVLPNTLSSVQPSAEVPTLLCDHAMTPFSSSEHEQVFLYHLSTLQAGMQEGERH